MRRSRYASLFALVLAASTGAPALGAAPPEPSGDPEAEACTETTLDDCKLMTARDLSKQGLARYEAGDFFGAISRWEQVLVLIPEQQASLGVNLAHSYRSAYEIDGDQDHLVAAMTLLSDLLASPELSDHTREDLEAQVTEIEAQLAALAEAEAEAQAERDEAMLREQARISELAIAKVNYDNQRKIQKIYHGVGGSMVGVGAGGLAAMGAFLALGAGVDRQGQSMAASTGVTTSEYTELLNRGKSYNRGALTAGVIGGVLSASGAAVLIVAALRGMKLVDPEQDAGASVALSANAGGLQLQF